MAKSHIDFTPHSSVARRMGAPALCLTLCSLGIGLPSNAQQAMPVPNAKELLLHRLVNAPAGISRAVATNRPSAAGALESAAAPNAHEIVLHHFASPPHGAYPDWGVIRDSAGNLYGTTNGSYSDVGGGGTNNAGVVYKVDNCGHETLLYSFTGGTDGSTPNSLILDSAGDLYGTTAEGGGPSSAGVVFKLDPSGHQTVLYTFTGGADGDSPYGGVVRDLAGNLYGVTSYGGGASGTGVVYKVDPKGHETVLHSFTGASDGGYPNPVIVDSAGNLYGTATIGGGTANAGVVFKVDPAGHETVLYTFSGGADGASPDAALSRDAAGDLYGTTYVGGADNAGVVFKLDATGHEKVLYTFTGGADGANPSAALILDEAGNLYGTTSGGGSAGLGVVFKVDRSGKETVLHTFTRSPYGDQPDLAGVIRDSEGNLYGTTAFNAGGGQGAVYKLDSSGNPTVLYAFPGAQDGQHPYNNGLTVGADGELYGSLFYGGRSGVGVVYSLDRHGDERVLYDFVQSISVGFGQPTGGVIRDAAGNFYGTTFTGQADVGRGFGVVYKVDTAGHSTVLHNFTNGADGGYPYGGVILDSAGNLYGTTTGGGASNAGVVFKIDPAGHEKVLYAFSGEADGGVPYGALIRDSKGNLYGTANVGGASDSGVVFKVDPSGHETVLYSFTGEDDGAGPLAGLIRDSDGNLYGTTNGGGAANAGVVFKVDPAGHETVLYSFTGGDDGGYPLWVTLARDAAGNLFGTTAGGGTANVGVVFKVDKSGNETVLYNFTGGDDGGNPYVGVVLCPDGTLYGTADSGGAESAGVLYEIKP